MKTYWFDLVCLEPPLHAIPGRQMCVTVKGGQEVSTLEGKAVRVGHQALSATEEEYVIRLKAELDEIIYILLPRSFRRTQRKGAVTGWSAHVRRRAGSQPATSRAVSR